MNRCAHRRHHVRQFYLYARQPQRLLPMIAWVAVDIVLWGFLTRYLNRSAAASISCRRCWARCCSGISSPA